MEREVGGRFEREGTEVYLQLTHGDVWQKPTKYGKAIILQFKINKLKNLGFKKPQVGWKLNIGRDYELKYPKRLECFPGGSVVKNLPVNAGDMGSIPGLGRFSGEGNDKPLQYSRLGNPMDREPGGLQLMGSQESDMTQ